VSGVLTRISAIEKEALSISAGRFVEGMAGRRVDPDLNRYLDTICDPDEVLRLCRAHRQIVEDYRDASAVEHRRRAEGASKDVMRHAIGKAQGLRRAVVALAVGLGVAEEDRNGE
jgi:hypothetical protein